jgi:dihydroflavonol-4-reductase
MAQQNRGKTLVTGATGFIGSHLVEKLVAEGEEVRCLVRPTSNLRWIQHLPVDTFVGDLFDSQSLDKALQGVRIIYHVAGVTKATRKRDYWRGNVEATSRFLETACRTRNAIERFVYVSSQAAVGPSLNGTPVDEATLPHPIDIYGRSKKAAEDLCRAYSNELPVTILRPVAVYGPRDLDTFAFFRWIGRGIIPMFGSDTKKIALVYVKDLVEGIVLASRRTEAIGQVYFLSNQTATSWEELFSVATVLGEKRMKKWVFPNFSIYLVAAAAEPMAFLTGKAVLYNFEKARELAQTNWSCDPSKARRELGYEAKTPILDGMRETFEWYKREGWLN